MKIDHSSILAALDREDRVRHYPACTDLTLAGEDYKVRQIVCFARTASDPLSDWIMVKQYDDGYLLILSYTENRALLSECMAYVCQAYICRTYVDNVAASFHEIELRTPYPSVFEMPELLDRFTLAKPEDSGSPVYYMHNAEQLPQHTPHAEVCISDHRETDRAEIAAAVSAGLLDPDYMNADMFVPCTVFSDVKWYILRVSGQLAGYLRAECGYANIYDIGWLYVEPRFRGHGYAVDLVMHFSKEMFAHGAIPHYGYAISAASERVAQKCGYITDPIPRTCYRLLPRKTEP